MRLGLLINFNVELIKHGITRVVNKLAAIHAKAQRRKEKRKAKSLSNLNSDKRLPPLGDMPADEFRRHGHELIDWIADYFRAHRRTPGARANRTRRSESTTSSVTTRTRRIDGSDPCRRRPADRSRAHALESSFILRLLRHFDFGAWNLWRVVERAFDVKSMLWRTSPASTELEEVVLDWLRQMIGLDAGMSGIIYDTASVSSMHAIAAAREGVEMRIREEGMSGRSDLPLLRVYASEQAHSSIDKGIITLGLGQRALRKIPTDKDFRMDVKALAAAIQEDKRAGFLPFCIVATVGTTSTSEH
jgi:aromatic-L-amino-acid decarboxylase